MNKTALLLLFVLAALAGGSWARETADSPEAVRIEVSAPRPGKPAPQAAKSVYVSWSVEASGGEAPLSYLFAFSRDGDAAQEVPTGSRPYIVWRPNSEGTYRVRATVTDASGHQARSAWSDPYEVVEPLRVIIPRPSLPAPQVTETPIRWTTRGGGGVGALSYRFELARDGGGAHQRHSVAEDRWTWIPGEAGVYRVRAIAIDDRGNEAKSPWSADYEIVPPLAVRPPVAGVESPQALGTVTIPWRAEASGGVGELEYEFAWSVAGKSPRIARRGSGPDWVWTPSVPGPHRVRVTVRDEAGNEASAWSETFAVAPRLAVSVPEPAKPSPQAAGSGPIAWSAEGSGGVGPKTVSFELSRDGGPPRELPAGSEPVSVWRPETEGSYRVRATVVDGRGNRAQSDWSDAFIITAPLAVGRPATAVAGPQAAGSVSIPWTVESTGGVGAPEFTFEIEKDGAEPRSVQSGPESTWSWAPELPGAYRVRAAATDERGNRAVGPWSDPFRIVPPVTVRALSPALPSPQAARSVPVPWSAEAAGGVGEKTFTFELAHDGEEGRTVQSGPDPAWAWRPESEGDYRVRVTVEDALGNRARSAWSPPFRIAPPLEVTSLEANRSFPQAALSLPIAWAMVASGGVGEKTYAFEVSRDGGAPRQVATGALSRWPWTPGEAGEYRVRGVVTDALGNRAAGAWSDPVRIAPPLTVSAPEPEVPGPQMLGPVEIPWGVEAAGGVGERTLEFLLMDPQGEISPVQSGAGPRWVWAPEAPGPYRVRVKATDSLGNEALSAWSAPYGIAPPLRTEIPTSDRPAPRAAQTVPIGWEAFAIGGVGEKTYLFELSRDGGEPMEIPAGPSSRWTWRPQEEGDYRVRVAVSDALGNRVESDWSEAYRIEPPLVVEAPVPGLAGPQVVKSAVISWTVASSGGVGDATHAFELSRDGEEPAPVPSGPQPAWDWLPETAGTYRVRAVMTDALGNVKTGPWSAPYEITPPVAVHSLTADIPGPQAAQTVTIGWRVEATGGVGEKVYIFEIQGADGLEQTVQRDTSPAWSWRPEEGGRFRVRVTAVDALGNQTASPWSEPYEVAPPLRLSLPKPDPEGEQFLVDTPVGWTVWTTGGVGSRTVFFELEKEGEEKVRVQEGSSERWKWRPRELGAFRVRAGFTDALGNRMLSPWTSPKEIVAHLALEGLAPELPSPQRALGTEIRWTARTVGGVGEVTYEFQTLKDGVLLTEQKETEPVWSWRPRKAGEYQVRVIVRDGNGKVIESVWSPAYRIEPAIGRDTPIAFLPVENLSGVKAPLQEVESAFTGRLLEAGFRILSPSDLRGFMKKHRMRHTGGIGSRLGRLLREETGAEAVFITSIESFQEGGPPKISLISRVVLTGERPEIVWMKSVGLTGVDAPGLLGLGLVNDPDRLLGEALQELLASFEAYLAGGEKTQRIASGAGGKIRADLSLDGRYLPRQHYRATSFDPGRRYAVAVVPFLNKYARKNAGFVAPLHFAETLHGYENLEVVEPGVVREHLLKYRMIMPAGPSLAISDILTSPAILDADLVLSGNVFDYQGLRGTVKVDFSVQVFEGKKREVVWWSRSATTGDEGVYFFDVGRLHTAHGLMNRMSGAIGAMMFDGTYP